MQGNDREQLGVGEMYTGRPMLVKHVLNFGACNTKKLPKKLDGGGSLASKLIGGVGCVTIATYTRRLGVCATVDYRCFEMSVQVSHWTI